MGETKIPKGKKIESSIGFLIGKPFQEIEQWLVKNGLDVSNKWEEEYLNGECHYVGWNEFGCEMKLEDEKIEIIWLKMVPMEDKKPFPFIPIEGVRQTDNMNQVEKVLGKPLEKNTRTDLKNIIMGIPSPLFPWLNYQVQGYYVNIKFTEEGEAIRELCFQKGEAISPHTLPLEPDLKIKSYETFTLKKGETAKMDTIDFYIKNQGVGKQIYLNGGEYEYVNLRLSFLSYDETVELGTGFGKEVQDRRFIFWHNISIWLDTFIDAYSGQVDLVVVADYYEYKDNVDPAFHKCLDKVQKGDAEAMLYLCKIYMEGDFGVEKDEKKALFWCEKSAQGCNEPRRGKPKDIRP